MTLAKLEFFICLNTCSINTACSKLLTLFLKNGREYSSLKVLGIEGAHQYKTFIQLRASRLSKKESFQ